MDEEDAPHANAKDDGLIERLDRLEELLRAQAARLYAVEQHLGLEPPLDVTRRRAPIQTPTSPATPANPTSPQIPNTPPPQTQPPPEVLDALRSAPPSSNVPPGGTTQDARREPGGGGVGARPAPTSATASVAKKTFNLERSIGGSLFNWVGIVAIAFGVAFFLKFAFDNQLITPAGRVALGAVAGLGILFAGDRLRARGLRSYASVISGGGILILYLSIYAAFAFYNLLGQLPAFLLMAAVTAAAVLLSVRHDALPIAVLGLVGGFLTPLLLSTGRDNQLGLFTYVALLDAGVLALAYFKRWRSLNYMSFVATLITVTGWATIHYAPHKLWTTLLFLTFFFILFSLIPLVHDDTRDRAGARWFDISFLVAGNAAFYFGLGYILLDGANYDRALGAFAALVAAFYLLLFLAARRRHATDALLVYSLCGAAITFLTTAVAIQLEQHWVTIAWAAEALVLTWVGLRSRERAPRRAALLVFAVAVLRWFADDLSSVDVWRAASAVASEGVAAATFVPLLNRRGASCAALVAVAVGVVWLYRRAGANVKERERRFITSAFVLAANALAFTLLTLDVYDYFELQKMRLFSATAGGDISDESYAPLSSAVANTQQFALSALWTLYGAAALFVGVARRIKPLRFAALILLAITVAKVTFLDVLFYDAAWHAPLLNQTFFAFALLIAALAACAYVYERAAASGGVTEEERSLVTASLVAVANVLAVVALSAEASGYFEKKVRAAVASGGLTGDLGLARQLSLSLVWAVYGGALLLFGHVRRNRMLRLMALALLGLTIVKVFFRDLAALEKVYRIASFIVLGLVLLAVSYLYQRSQQRAAADDEAEGETQI